MFYPKPLELRREMEAKMEKRWNKLYLYLYTLPRGEEYASF